VAAIRSFLIAHAVGDLVPRSVSDEAARLFGCPPAVVEATTLEAGLLPARYQRNRKTLSIEQQLAIFQTRVAVIGCGGLGGHVIEGLARLGVGTIVAVDPDRFEEHNLNRQLLCTLDTLGQPKAAAAVARVQRINPAVTVVAVPRALHADNGREILSGCEIAVDALDSIPTRVELAELCGDLSLPLVHGAIAGWYGQIAVQLPGERTVLDLLRGYKAESGIEKEVGNPSFAPALVAALQTVEVCKLIVCRDKAISGRILFIDLLEMRFEEMRVS